VIGPRVVIIRFSLPLILAAVIAAGIDESQILPVDAPAIQYATAPTSDRASRLDRRLRSGEITLAYDRDYGYLISLLKALDVPVASQVLVFSKTSFQAPRISPRTPRAVYHSPDASVGFVRGGDVLEIAAVDPRQGVIFYTLDQEESAKPQFVRREECMHCHHGASTLGVPGLVVRSVHTDRNGAALLTARAFVNDHRSPLDQRWGGWYVTGLSGGQHHMGNRFTDAPDASNVTDLSPFIDPGAYLAPQSDIVSLMVLEHQTRFTNLVTRVNWESRLGRDTAATATELVRYLLFADEAPLTAPIQGGTAFTAAFSAAAIRDKSGRSLRDFDLKSRLFRYRCSYMIYTEQFDAIPAPARDQVLRRVYAILTGAEPSAYPEPVRRATLEILRETKPALPAYFSAP
jgi:hypothetical protein